MSRKVLVVGLSKSGLAAIKLLEKFNYDITLTTKEVLDANTKEQLNKIKIYDGGHPLELLNEDYEFIVKNPGIPYHVEFIAQAVEKGFKIISEIELGYLHSNNVNLAITGTNGKTTTTTLAYEIIKKYYANTYLAGNIGFPLCDVVLKHDKDNYIVMELSSFQLMGIETFKPKIATIMNLSPDHLDYMATVEEYYESKTSIYQNQDASDYFILNLDDELVNQYVDNVKATIISVSLSDDTADIYVKDNYIYYANEQILALDKIKLIGQHNLYNIMFALAYAKLVGVDNQTIQDVVYDFGGVEYRLEFIKEDKQNNQYYNDSKATTPDSTITALNAFNDESIVLIVGGKDKNLDLNPLIDLINQKENVKAVLSFGQIKNSFKNSNKENIVFETLDDVMNYIKKTYQNQVILFSPATSSFDQFKNYEVRGAYFNTLVEEV